MSDLMKRMISGERVLTESFEQAETKRLNIGEAREVGPDGEDVEKQNEAKVSEAKLSPEMKALMKAAEKAKKEGKDAELGKITAKMEKLKTNEGDAAKKEEFDTVEVHDTKGKHVGDVKMNKDSTKHLINTVKALGGKAKKKANEAEDPKGKFVPEAPGTKSQKKGEVADGEGIEKQAGDPGNTSVGKVPAQPGTPMPQAPATKTQKSAEKDVVGRVAIMGEAEDKTKGAQHDQQGEDPTKIAASTKTTDAASKLPEETPELIDEPASEARVNEQEPDEEAPVESPVDIGEPVSPPEGEVKDEELPDKEYLGNKEDIHFYLVRVKDVGANVSDIIIVDAEDGQVFSAKDKDAEVDLSDERSIVLDAINEIDLDTISFDLFMKYFYPVLSGEEQEKEEEEEEEEEEVETPADEDSDEEPLEGRIPNVKDDSEGKIIDALKEKYGLK